METIKIKSVKIKKQTDTFTIYEIETEAGIKLDTFEQFKEGEEIKGTITPNEKNPKYNALFKSEKAGTKRAFIPKDTTWEKRLGALTCATNLLISGAIIDKQLMATADKFYQYLIKK